jgi:Gamma tubulin complex component N-terminal
VPLIFLTRNYERKLRISASDSALIPNDSWKLEEAKLLKELLYCFHGIDGQVLTVKHQSYVKLPVFELASKVLGIQTDFRADFNEFSLQVHDESVRQNVLHLAALGSLAKYLDDFIEQSCIDQVSLYRGALASAIQKERSDYVRILSEVECQQTQPDRVTFARLRCQMHLAKRRLQWQVEAVRVHRHSIGCNVLSTLYFLIQNGNPMAFNGLSPIFLQVHIWC